MTVGVVDVLEVVGVDGDDDSGVVNFLDDSGVNSTVEEFGQGVNSEGDMRVVNEQERDGGRCTKVVVVVVGEDASENDADNQNRDEGE